MSLIFANWVFHNDNLGTTDPMKLTVARIKSFNSIPNVFDEKIRGELEDLLTIQLIKYLCSEYSNRTLELSRAILYCYLLGNFSVKSLRSRFKDLIEVATFVDKFIEVITVEFIDILVNDIDDDERRKLLKGIGHLDELHPTFSWLLVMDILEKLPSGDAWNRLISNQTISFVDIVKHLFKSNQTKPEHYPRLVKLAKTIPGNVTSNYFMTLIRPCCCV